MTTSRSERETRADERKRIVDYLQHISRVDIGTVLTPEGRELVGMCATWIENRLDAEWRSRMGRL